MTDKPKPRTPKAARRDDQRRVHQERRHRADLRKRLDPPDLLPVREDEARYRP